VVPGAIDFGLIADGFSSAAVELRLLNPMPIFNSSATTVLVDDIFLAVADPCVELSVVRGAAAPLLSMSNSGDTNIRESGDADAIKLQLQGTLIGTVTYHAGEDCVLGASADSDSEAEGGRGSGGSRAGHVGGTLVVMTNNSNPALAVIEVPYQATVVQGGIGFDQQHSIFILGDSLLALQRDRGRERERGASEGTCPDSASPSRSRSTRTMGKHQNTASAARRQSQSSDHESPGSDQRAAADDSIGIGSRRRSGIPRRDTTSTRNSDTAKNSNSTSTSIAASASATASSTAAVKSVRNMPVNNDGEKMKNTTDLFRSPSSADTLDDASTTTDISADNDGCEEDINFEGDEKSGGDLVTTRELIFTNYFSEPVRTASNIMSIGMSDHCNYRAACRTFTDPQPRFELIR
jgi:hypothetical protein